MCWELKAQWGRWGAGLAVALLAAGPPAATASGLEVREWPVPWPDTRPRDPAVDGHGRVWFVGQWGDYLAELDPEQGTFRRFELPEGSAPHNLVLDPQGMVWYAGNGDAHIGRLDPRTGKITRYVMPDPEAADPHTLCFDGKGRLWFTVQGGNFVGLLIPGRPGSGAVRLFPVPTAYARPYGIVVTPDDRPWIAEFGANKLASLDPATLELREVQLPRREARPRRLAITSDGTVWYTDHARGFLGAYQPRTGDIREWRTPGGSKSAPYALAADHRNDLWFVETGMHPNRLVGFDPALLRFTPPTPIPSGGGTVRHMIFHPPTRTLWFGTDTDTVARVRVP